MTHTEKALLIAVCGLLACVGLYALRKASTARETARKAVAFYQEEQDLLAQLKLLGKYWSCGYTPNLADLAYFHADPAVIAKTKELLAALADLRKARLTLELEVNEADRAEAIKMAQAVARSVETQTKGVTR